MKTIPQTTLSIFTAVGPNKNLVDIRPAHFGENFGTVSQAASQFGVKVRKQGSLYEYYAPKSRIEKFVEKLHFSGIPYSS